jgi:hypothetical protein
VGKPAEKEYEIHYYEVDKWKRVLPTSIMDYFSDICTMQSDKEGITPWTTWRKTTLHGSFTSGT